MGIQNLDINPYYDDFDETKNYHRILFRPGYAVQARELTQLQTILQNQISKFGKHIFKDGSMVLGGELTYSNSVKYLRITSEDIDGNLVDVNNFDGKIISNQAGYKFGGGIGKVVAVNTGDTVNAASLIVQYTTGAKNFDANTTIYTIEDVTNTAITVANTSSFTGNASVFSIANGVYFIYDHFVSVEPQTILLSVDTTTPSCRVGLEITDQIVTELQDSTLLDPALNASNFQAPGATRLKISATLSTRTLDSTDDSKFIELARIEDGVLTKIKKYTDYAELEKTLARRTYDQSGDYTVTPFLIDLKDHVPSAGNTSNSELFTATLSPGKAYIRGFEFETISPTNFEVARARTTQNVNNKVINTTYGNYFKASNVSGTFDISTMQTVDLHCVPSINVTTTNTATYGSTNIGTGRVRQVSYLDSSNTQVSSTYRYEMYLFDTRFNSVSNNATSGTTNTITLAPGGAAAARANAYLGAYLRITTGSGADNTPRKIINYDSSTRVVTVDSNFSASPTTNSVYSIDFSIKDLESVLVKAGTSGYSANADVDVSNKIGSVSTGDAFLSDTDYNTLVFPMPQNYVAFGIADQSYRGKKAFLAQAPSANVVTIDVSGSTYFIGSGALSDANKLEHFYVVTRTAAAGLSANSIVPMVTSTGRSITISNGGQRAELNLGNNQFTSVDVIASVDYTAASQRTKTLNLANTTNVAVSGGTSIGNTTIYTTHGQVAISTPNKVAGNTDSLYVSDIHKLDGKFETQYGYFSVRKTDGTTTLSSFKVIDSGNSSAAVVTADLTNSSKDITYKYILDDGQRDNYYDHGNIILRPSVSPPVGQLLVLFNYFTHGSDTGYLSVDSYNNTSLGANTTVRYAKVPSFVSPTTGKSYSLRDVIDFRPIRQNSSNTIPNFTLSGIGIPKDDGSITVDYGYYVGRNDRLVLKSERQFQLISGIPDVIPQTPTEPDNAMSLYTLNIPPYTFFPNDVKVTFFKNKRYTMKDIGKIEKRVENLEYYTALSLLEKDTKATTITDSTGMIRYKNGFLVDSFTGHGIGDVSIIDYNCSVDTSLGELRPAFVSNSIDFNTDASTTANVTSDKIAIAPYTVVSAIEQDIASSQLKINEFLFTNFVGTMKLSPAGDVWVDHNQRPDVLVNLEGNNDAWVAIGSGLQDSRAPGFGTQWNDWSTVASSVTGTDISQYTQQTASTVDLVQRTTTTVSETQTRSGTVTTIVPDTIVQSIGNKQVDFSVIPYIRAQKVYFAADNMSPNTLMFAYFDDIRVNRFIETPSILLLYNATKNFNSAFGNSEIITSSSGGSAKVVKQHGYTWSTNWNRIEIVDVRGTFAANDTITGALSGATAKIDLPLIKSGNATSATANTIILSTGMPYNNIYSDYSNTMSSLIAANTFYKTRGTFDTVTYNPSKLNETLGMNIIKIVSGTGLGQAREIVSYNASTKTATVSSNWDVQPDSTSIYSIGNMITTDIGSLNGIFHLPSYSQTSYDSGYKFRTGSRKFRFCDDPDNNESRIFSFSDVNFYATGFLNTVENVSVSVRVPKIQTKSINDVRNITSSSTTDSLLSSTPISYFGNYYWVWNEAGGTANPGDGAPPSADSAATGACSPDPGDAPGSEVGAGFEGSV